MAVILACRNPARGEALRKDLETKYLSAEGAGAKEKKGSIEVMHLDLADLDSVAAFAEAFNAKGQRLDILVNNAGVFAMSAPRSVCFHDRYELHLLTNYLSCALLTLLLVPSLVRKPTGKGAKSAPKAKVVMVNSKLHQMCTGFNFENPNFDGKGAYNSKKAYAQSKLAQMLFTNHLRLKLAEHFKGRKDGSPVDLLVLHPGNVTTDVVRTLPWAVRKAYGFFMPLFLLSPEEGARSTLFTATESEAAAAKADLPGTQGERHYYYNSNCEPVMPSEESRDAAEAEKMWAWTLDQVRDPYLNNVTDKHLTALLTKTFS